MESVLLYFSKQNIKKSLTRLGNASIVMLEAPKELPVEQSSCALERGEQRLNFIVQWVKEHSKGTQIIKENSEVSSIPNGIPALIEQLSTSPVLSEEIDESRCDCSKGSSSQCDCSKGSSSQCDHSKGSSSQCNRSKGSSSQCDRSNTTTNQTNHPNTTTNTTTNTILNNQKTYTSSFKILPFEKALEEIDSIYTFLTEKTALTEKSKEELSRIEEDCHMTRQIHRITQMPLTENDTRIPLHVLTGITDPDQKVIMKKLLRIRLRRNVVIKSQDQTLISNGRDRTFFVVYTPNKQAMATAQKVFTSVGGRAHVPDTPVKQLERDFRATKRRISRLEREMACTAAEIRERIPHWKRAVLQEKRILQALATLQDGGTYMTGDGWIPTRCLPDLARLCSTDPTEGRFTFEVQKPTLTPPTHIRVTPLTAAFQNLTNVFGVPHYNELNPALFLIFTFPFLFGAMFGDVLHGLVLLVLSLILIRASPRLHGRCGVFQIILDGSYVMLLCGLAAIWFGLLYGDLGSLPLSLFPSRYDPHGHRSLPGTYPFGIDPIWHRADNGMIFVNNLKMKLSLVIGFAHMGLGALISLFNAVHSCDRITLFCETAPQFISFFLFLGYVVFLCFYKWIVTHNYPSIINTLIRMYTEPFNIQEQVYPGQLYVQLFILSVLLVCIPWMFFSKPMYLITRRKVPPTGLLDLWISSGIHLVEFCLGLISNTSSYLRLWAVSLAHVQLTSVLHQFTIGSNNRLVSIITFPIYLSGTFMLLIGLEGLSAALHALRLNWIEFFSKFYSGSGWEYIPYNFEEIE